MIRFPAGPELDLDAGLDAVLLRLDEAQPALTAREERRGDLLEVLGDGRERLGEPALDRGGELCAQLLELLQALLEIGALRLEVVETLLLRLVLLPRERVDLPERRAARLEPVDAGRELVAVVALRRLDLARGVEPSRRLRDVGVDARELHLGGCHGGARLLELAPEVHLRRAERAQLLAELAGPGRARVHTGAERRLEPVGRSPGRLDPVAQRRRERRPAARASTRRSRRRGALGARPSAASAARARSAAVFREARRRRDLLLERRCFGSERGPPALELEQDRLGRLADEPELAARGVVAEALGRDGRRRDVEQRLERDDRELRDELLRSAPCEHGEAAEPCRTGALQEREPHGRVVRDDGRRPRPERGRDGPLGACRHVERRERETRPVLGERPRSRRQALLLGERLLESADALADELGALGDRDPLSLGARAPPPRREPPPTRAARARSGVSASSGTAGVSAWNRSSSAAADSDLSSRRSLPPWSR